MLLPHEVVTDAARIARSLADQAMDAGESDHSAFFEQVAAEADERADRLQFVWARRRSVRADLVGWIRDLRGRIERGDLVDLSPIELGYGTGYLTGERIVRVMLADLDHLDGLPPDAPERTDRRAVLLDDFRLLRDLLGSCGARDHLRDRYCAGNAEPDSTTSDHAGSP